MKKYLILIFTSIVMFIQIIQTNALAQNSTTPGQVKVDPSTISTIGLVWEISGDDNGTAKVEVWYREKNSSSSWIQALPFLRVENKTIGAVNPGNILAGSIFGLKPGTTYEIKLSLFDSDGGSDTRFVDVTTRKAPVETNLNNAKFVVPGSGGGSGTETDPYKGLAEADKNARPGDVFLLKAGTYSAITFRTSGTASSPIIYHGEDRSSVIIEGENTVSDRKYVYLENMTLKCSGNCIAGHNTEGLVIRNNKIERTAANTATAVLLSGASKYAYVCDNKITGKNEPWRPGTWEEFRKRDAGGFGIKISGEGHTICHNYVYGFWDAIGMANDDSRNAGISIDIMYNDISYAIDDGIETDYSHRNIRVMYNRIANTLKGVSAQPVYGGPVYIIRNEMYNIDSSPYKFHESSGRKPSGLMVFHNSTASSRHSFKGGDWRNGFFRNNLFFAREGYGLATVGNLPYSGENSWAPTIFDYNGYGNKPLYFNGTKYSDVNDFCARKQYECHGRQTSNSIWVNVPPPQGFGRSTPAEPGDWDFTLKEEATDATKAVDLPNVNDDRIGTYAEQGALEKGKPAPTYGPRWSSGQTDEDSDGWSPPDDCNDHDPSIHPQAPEKCNNKDDNCNGSIDEGDVCNNPPQDKDKDGYDETVDCNDNDPSVHPGATEICDGIDNNCSGGIDEGFNVGKPCSAGVGVCKRDGTYQCTADGKSKCSAVAAPPPEAVEQSCSDNLDNDCDSFIDTNDSDCPQPNECIDKDKDGYGPGCKAGGDCNDNDPSVHPGAKEICDKIDNNCNGAIDEDNVCTPGNKDKDVKKEKSVGPEPKVSSGCSADGYSPALLIALIISAAVILRKVFKKNKSS